MILCIYFLASKNALVAGEEQITFKDCAEAFKSGFTTSGIFTLSVPNTGEEKKVFVVSLLNFLIMRNLFPDQE